MSAPTHDQPTQNVTTAHLVTVLEDVAGQLLLRRPPLLPTAAGLLPPCTVMNDDSPDWVRARARTWSARGTTAGLRELLTVLSGGYPVEITDGGGVYREGECPRREARWVQVRMPLLHHLTPEDVLEIVRGEVPAGVVVDLVVVPRPEVPAVSFLGPYPAVLPPERPGPTVEVAVPGGPFFGDGGTEDVYAPLLEEDPPAVRAPVPSGERRRLPGVGGRTAGAGNSQPLHQLCPVCAEPGPLQARHCRRCTAPMELTAPTTAPADPPDPPDPQGPAAPRSWQAGDVLLAGLLLALVLAGYLFFR